MAVSCGLANSRRMDQLPNNGSSLVDQRNLYFNLTGRLTGAFILFLIELDGGTFIVTPMASFKTFAK